MFTRKRACPRRDLPEGDNAMQTAVVFVILALAGVYLFFRFRRSVSGGGCGCGCGNCSCAKKGGCATHGVPLETHMQKHD